MFPGTHSLFPAVLVRELRAAARRRGTYWLRVVVAATALVALELQLTGGQIATRLGAGRMTPQRGAELFALLHTVLSVGLLLAAPLFAADTIARERREGTLGLLGLTPLRPIEIVLGKAFAQIVRLLSLWLVCVPVLLIPFLMGGVSALDLRLALGIEFILVIGGLSAGLVATSLCRQWNRSAGLAFVLMLAGGQCLTFLTASGILTAARNQPSIPAGDLANANPGELSLHLWFLATGLNEGGFGGIFAFLPPWMSTTVQQLLLAAVLGVTVAFCGAALIAGWRVRRELRPSGPRSIEPSRSKRMQRNVAFGLSERRRRHWLDHNPSRWLWEKAGAGTWGRAGWLLAVGLLWMATVWFARNDPTWFSIPYFIPLVLTIPMAMNAASSLRREMEEGTLELLLVTPLPARDLVWARVREAWSVLVPALLLNLALIPFAPQRPSYEAAPLYIACLAGMTTIAALPAVGIRYAVRRLHPLSGFLWSILTVSILPYLIGLASLAALDSRGPGQWEFDPVGQALSFGVGFGLTQFLLSSVWGWLAARDLELRWYLFRPFQRRPG